MFIIKTEPAKVYSKRLKINGGVSWNSPKNYKWILNRGNTVRDEWWWLVEKREEAYKLIDEFKKNNKGVKVYKMGTTFPIP